MSLRARTTACIGSVALGVALMAMPASVAAHGTIVATPQNLWHVWTVPPLPAIVLLGAIWLYVRGTGRIWEIAGRGRGVHYGNVAAFFGAIALLAVALLSPIDTMADALLFVHMIQHMVLLVAVPLLLVLGDPLPPMLDALPRRWRRVAARAMRQRPIREPIGWGVSVGPAWTIATLVLWGWHLPGPFDLAVRQPIVHDVEHLTFVGAGLLYWTSIVGSGRSRHQASPGRIASLFTTMLQGSALGMLMLFSRTPWYVVYGHRSPLWHLTPLHDQQLAAAIMWIPPGVIYLVVLVRLVVAALSEPGPDPAPAPVRRSGHGRVAPAGDYAGAKESRP